MNPPVLIQRMPVVRRQSVQKEKDTFVKREEVESKESGDSIPLMLRSEARRVVQTSPISTGRRSLEENYATPKKIIGPDITRMAQNINNRVVFSHERSYSGEKYL